MKPLHDCRLYGFVDTAYLRGRPAAEIAQMLCEGGADLVQLRSKDLPIESIRALAEQILPVTRSAGVGLVINDYLTLAHEVGAEFCHLGQEDFFDADYTHVSQLPTPAERPRIGLSTHTPEQAMRAVAAGADYVAVGPVYATPTKPGARPVTLDYVRWAAHHVQRPWFAIGGIHSGNLGEVLAAGARRICVVSAILNAPDPKLACSELRKTLDRFLDAC